MVEDSPLDQTLYRAYLDELPVEVVCADTLTQALVLLVEWPIDLVLLDLGLPDADADDPLSSLQKIKAVMPDLPVLIVSANEANGNEQQAAALGAEDWITKQDLTRSALQRIVRTMLGRVQYSKKVETLMTAVARADSALRTIEDGLTRMAKSAYRGPV